MRYLSLLIIALAVSSCIPVKIAPQIKDYKIKSGQKFHKNLSHHQAFIFNDPKDAYEFYSFINIVYELNNIDVAADVPFLINSKEYYFSFHEVERTSNTLNLIPVIIDLKLKEEGVGPLLEPIYESRKGNWYIIVNVFDSDGNDALHLENKSRKEVERYLKEMKTLYFSHHNYYEALFKKSPNL